MLDRAGLIARLHELGVVVDEHAHAPVHTCEEAERIVRGVGGERTKNLFLRDRKGRRHLLLVIRPEQSIDLTALSEQLGTRGLSLASRERLMRYLGVEPGSVSPLALLNDTANAVELIVDAQLWRGGTLQCHPLINTHTLALACRDLERVLASGGHTVRAMVLPQRGG